MKKAIAFVVLVSPLAVMFCLALSKLQELQGC